MRYRWEISSPNLSANPVRAGTICPDRTPRELSMEERTRSFWESTGSEVSRDTGPHTEGRSGRVKTARRPLGTSQFKSTQLSEDSRAHAHFPRLSGAYDFDQHGAAQVTLCDFPGGHKAMQLLPCFLDTHTRNPELPRQKSTLCGHQAVKKLTRVESPWKGVCLPVLSARFPSRQQASVCTTLQVTRPPARSGRR